MTLQALGQLGDIKYICEECKKSTLAPKERFSRWIRCKCGGMAFEEGYQDTNSPLSCRGGLK